MKFEHVYNKYKSRLELVDAKLRTTIATEDKDLYDSSLQLLEAGGKRIRPLFAFICSQLGSANDEDVLAVASGLELIHMATLVHDDVIDNSDVRRGHPTVRAQYGNRAAMYVGDFLFARAIELLSQPKSAWIHQEVSKTIVKVCKGEIEQLRDFYDWGQNFRTYLRRIERKTALLIATSCALGAHVAQLSAVDVQRLRRFGYLTGMAFQIVDDVLDFTAEQETLGKPVGGDLRQGNLTLPALIAVKATKRGSQLTGLVRPGMSNEDANLALDIVTETDALEKSRDLAHQYLQKALELLEPYHEHEEVVQELSLVAEFVNQRLY